MIDTEAKDLILCPSDAENRLIGKDLDAGKDWGQEKVAKQDEKVGWHHQFNGRESGQTLRDSKGQGILACCSPWGHKELDMTEPLNNNNQIYSQNGIAVGKIFENHVIDKRLISKTCKKSMQINMKKKKTIKKWAEDLNRPFSKDDKQLSNCCSVTKSCPTFVWLHKL